MLHAIETSLKPEIDDCVGRNFADQVRAALDLEITSAKVRKTYIVEGLEKAELERAVTDSVLHDPVLQSASLYATASDADWIIEVGFRPGVTDNEGRTARDTLALVLGRPRDFAVYTTTQYHIKSGISLEDVKRIATDLLANELIQRHSIKSGGEWEASPGFEARAARVTGSASSQVAAIPLSSMNDDELMTLSRVSTWAF